MGSVMNSATFTCKECQSGKMHRRFLTYITWLGIELITVPDFPAWVCDVCHRREYDFRALNRLSLLLSPNAGRSSQHSGSAPIKPESSEPQPPTRAE
jgi:YgiT-type zinc finger domain-containing protein